MIAARVEAVGGISTDFTEIKQREEMNRELAVSSFKPSSTMPIYGLTYWIRTAKIVIWNKAAESISGYSSQEVIGHDKIWEWLYPEEAESETD